MKKITTILIALATTFLFSCGGQQNCSNGQQDSGETGVDCGGNCPPCAIPTGGGSGSGSGGSGGGSGGGGATPTTLQNLQGLWHLTHSTFSNGEYGVFYVGQSAKLDFSMNAYSVTGYYEVSGTPTTLTYPALSPYNVNTQGTHITPGGYFINNLTSTNLELQFSGNRYFYNRQDWTPTTLEWKISFDVAPTYSNTVFLQDKIIISGVSPVITTDLVPGQTTYTGSVNYQAGITSLTASIQAYNTLSNNVNVTHTLLVDGDTLTEKTIYSGSGSTITYNATGLTFNNQ